MRTLQLLLAWLVIASPVQAQPPDPPEGAPIASAQVSGFDLGQLSPGLQDQIGRLAGGPLNRDQLRALANRIEEEQPKFVAAVRVVRAPDDEVRVVFVVAHMRDQDRHANVNARYLIERAEVRGILEADLSAALRAELQTLVGKPLGADEVGQLQTRLQGELPDHEVRRRVVRGSRSGEVRLMFVVNKTESARWLRFEPPQSNVVYHSDQGWGALLDLPIGGRDLRFTPIIAISNGDDLIEEYSGFGLRVEARKLGTERLGVSLEWSSFDQTWERATLAALEVSPHIPRAYDDRTTVTSMLTFAVTPQLSVSGGVSVTELEPLSRMPDSQAANVAIASAGYRRRWESDTTGTHEVAASFIVRAGTETLDSDFTYRRYLGLAEYRYQRSHHTVLVRGMGGGIDGDAPLFERFSLGDSRTLRGWDKYDLAPAGGGRLFYTSLEYRLRGLAFFLDAGSVWDAEGDARIRTATGIGFHPGPFFITLGFPLNTKEVRAVFATGIRFGGIGVRKY